MKEKEREVASGTPTHSLTLRIKPLCDALHTNATLHTHATLPTTRSVADLQVLPRDPTHIPEGAARHQGGPRRGLQPLRRPPRSPQGVHLLPPRPSPGAGQEAACRNSRQEGPDASQPPSLLGLHLPGLQPRCCAAQPPRLWRDQAPHLRQGEGDCRLRQVRDHQLPAHQAQEDDEPRRVRHANRPPPRHPGARGAADGRRERVLRKGQGPPREQGPAEAQGGEKFGNPKGSEVSKEEKTPHLPNSKIPA